jgi:hypothetical protein
MKVTFWLMLVVTTPDHESFVEFGNYATMEQCNATDRAEIVKRARGETKVRFSCIQEEHTAERCARMLR